MFWRIIKMLGTILALFSPRTEVASSDWPQLAIAGEPAAFPLS
jgi:hypothetical protein